MLIDQTDMLEALQEEIEDRSATMVQLDSTDQADIQTEIDGLKSLHHKVSNKLSLTYDEYDWLAYVVGNWMIAAQE